MAGAIERGIPYIPSTLRESFGKRPIPDKEEMIMGIIDRIEDLNLPQKRDIYFYYLWQEDRDSAFLKVKSLVGEVREDEFERVLVRVERDNFVTEKYEEFHAEFLRQTQEERLPAARKILKERIDAEDAAKEADVDLETVKALADGSMDMEALKSVYKKFIDEAKKNKVNMNEAMLGEIIEDKDLKPDETRAYMAADVLSISLIDKRILFGAYEFIHYGTFRAGELLGVSPMQIVNMRDRAKATKNFQEKWNRFNFLLNPDVLAVAVLKKQKRKHKDIGLELGLAETRVDEISKFLIATEIIQISPRGKGRAHEFEKIVELVDIEDETTLEGEPRKTRLELAKKLHVSSSTIKRARQRIRIRNGEKATSPKLSKKPHYELNKRRRAQVKEGMERGLTNHQISSEYGIPFNSVRYQKKVLSRAKPQ